MNVRTLVSFEPGDYQDWQMELLAHTYQEVGQEGALTGLASVRAGSGIKQYGFEVVTTRWMSRHPLTKDHYPPYNKPASFCDYFTTTPCRDEMLLLLDPDMVFVRSWRVEGVDPVAEFTSYMDPRTKGKNIVRRHCTRNATVVQPVGFPLIIQETELRVIADRWYILTEQMRDDRFTRKEANWICEMFAFSIAAAECGIHFKVERNCSFSNEGLNPDHCLIHYTYPMISPSGFLWDKRKYHAWNPMPPLKEDVPTAGKALYEIIENYRKVKFNLNGQLV